MAYLNYMQYPQKQMYTKKHTVDEKNEKYAGQFYSLGPSTLPNPSQIPVVGIAKQAQEDKQNIPSSKHQR